MGNDWPGYRVVKDGRPIPRPPKDHHKKEREDFQEMLDREVENETDSSHIHDNR